VTSPRGPRAVVFDLGHTLVDFSLAEDRLLECYEDVRRMLTAESYRDLPDAPALVEGLTRRAERLMIESYEKGRLQELDMVSLFDEGLRNLELFLPAELVLRVAEIEHAAMFSRLQVPGENLDVLRELQDMGLRTGLVSNVHFLPHLMRSDMERLGVAPYLDAMVFSSEIGVRKPHRAIFLNVLNALDVRPADALFVGDRIKDDIRGAQRLGMITVLTQQYRDESPEGSSVQPDYVIRALPELVPYVRAMLRVPDPKEREW
jgi:putative hydrolase of the HAD superfamily